MKQYRIILNVEDDFNPEEDLEGISLNCDPEKVEVAEEGFYTISDDVVPIVQEFLDSIEVLKEDVKETDVIRVTFPVEAASNPFFSDIITSLKVSIENACKVPVICHVDNLEVMVENASDAIEMLNGMIAKVKTRAAVKDTSGIILPN